MGDRWFTEYIGKRKLPPFFRYTVSLQIRGVLEFEWESKAFKIMAFVVTVGKPRDVVERLRAFTKRCVKAFFYRSLQVGSEAYETEQISRNEISPARLYRAYFVVDDVTEYAEDLY